MTQRCKPVFLAVVTAALLLTAFLTPALGDEIKGDASAPAVELARAKVTLAAKTRDFVETNIGDRWEITKHPLIIGLNGKQVTLKALPVPCDVEILYYPKAKGNQEAYRIDIKRIAPGAHMRYSDTVE